MTNVSQYLRVSVVVEVMALALTLSQTKYVLSVQSQAKGKNTVMGFSTETNMLYQIGCCVRRVVDMGIKHMNNNNHIVQSFFSKVSRIKLRFFES